MMAHVPRRVLAAVAAAVAAVGVAAVLVTGCAGTSSAPSSPTAPVTPSGEPPLTGLAGPKAAGDLDVMTFNIQDQTIAGADVYVSSGRRRAAAQVVANARPDVLGTQEMLPEQVAALQEDLTAAGLRYAWYGRPRVSDEGGRPDDYNETNAVFWNTDALDAVDRGDVWFCPPGEPAVQGCIDRGPGWRAGDPRMATWVRLRDKGSGAELVAVNTHLDAEPPQARERGAERIVELVRKVAGDTPVVLTGDFNSGPDAAPHRVLLADGFVDVWPAAQRTGPDWGTFNRTDPKAPAPGPRIDRVYTRPGLTVVAAVGDTYRPGGVFPSDHYPVVSRIRLTTGP